MLNVLHGTINAIAFFLRVHVFRHYFTDKEAYSLKNNSSKRVFLQWCHRRSIFSSPRTFQCWTVLKRTIFLNVTNILKYKEPFVEWKGSKNVKGFIRTIEKKCKSVFHNIASVQDAKCCNPVRFVLEIFICVKTFYTHARSLRLYFSRAKSSVKIHFSPPRNPGQTTERSEEGWRDVSPLLLCTPPSLSHPKWREDNSTRSEHKERAQGAACNTAPLFLCFFLSMRLAAQSACRGPWHSNGNTKALSSLFMGPLTALKSSCQGPARSQLVNVPAGGGSCHPAQRRSSLYGSLRPPLSQGPPSRSQHRWVWEAEHIVGITGSCGPACCTGIIRHIDLCKAGVSWLGADGDVNVNAC